MPERRSRANDQAMKVLVSIAAFLYIADETWRVAFSLTGDASVAAWCTAGVMLLVLIVVWTHGKDYFLPKPDFAKSVPPPSPRDPIA